ncbi:uncharacterized protein LOC114165140 [Vigna unguiculata]|uniref:uncharacterized protein LOC114165140 n=1 Tax=Vigna unguiculata TaxID=3917 RepID=UPI001017056F|nr:uncharacterized protein LOC114165140 [Vigna unguiculata]
MYSPDRSKTMFIIDKVNYCYEVMPFGLKNARATYHGLMDQVFRDQISRTMEVYVDDMVVKSQTAEDHARDLKEVFHQIRKYNMHLNPEKCVFGVPVGKFLGFMLIARGIEANPDKCTAITEMRSPKILKEIQRLVGRLTSLARFLPKLTERIRSILKIMKKQTADKWDDRCEEAFQQIKGMISSPPIMSRPMEELPLQLYLFVSDDTISATLVQENPKQRPIYFISRVLQGAETRKPYLARRMIAWSVELSEFGLKYEPRGSVKGQHLADFAAELHGSASHQEQTWVLFVYGSSDKCNAEYEALIAGLRLTKDLGARRLKCNTDSRLMVGQVQGEYQVKDDLLLQYYHKVVEAMKEFEEVTVHHIPRAENTRADRLSKLAEGKEKGHLKTIIRQTLMMPSAGECSAVDRPADWRSQFWELLRRSDAGEDMKPIERRQALRFVIIGEDLYKRGFTVLLLKCLSEEEAGYVMNEVHNGVCGMHTSRRTMKARILQAGYYWPTME